MSSTNRGGQRVEHDVYATPAWCTRRFLEDGPDLPGGVWYEPCAGEGAIVEVVQQYYPDLRWKLADVRSESCQVLRDRWPQHQVKEESVLEVASLDEEPSVIITNPPFAIAWEMLNHLLSSYRDTHVVLLLRLNFIGTDVRQSFMSTFAPDLYVLPNRPSFTGSGKTDSIEYAWYHWLPAPRFRDVGGYKVLPSTPLEERRVGG